MKWKFFFIVLTIHFIITSLGGAIYLDYKNPYDIGGDSGGLLFIHIFIPILLSNVFYLFMFLLTKFLTNVIRCLNFKETILNNILINIALSAFSFFVLCYISFVDSTSIFATLVFIAMFWGNIVFILLEVAKGIIYRFFK